MNPYRHYVFTGRIGNGGYSLEIIPQYGDTGATVKLANRRAVLIAFDKDGAVTAKFERDYPVDATNAVIRASMRNIAS